LSTIYAITSDQSLKQGSMEAVRVISEGGMVAFPTESFYGLGVDATNTQAIERLFHIKKRDHRLPILILISSLRELPRYVVSIPSRAKRLGEAFWPGGLTMIFQASTVLSSALTSGTGKVGIRISSHPVAIDLSRSLHVPITATSANISGISPCVTADQVKSWFHHAVDLILDGGKTPGGHPSTILDVTIDPPRMIREGLVKREEIIARGIYKQIAGL
jgi:L-threonylcarbamoyladenylate synthase